MATQAYWTEMGDKKPVTTLETDYCWGGGHWIYSPIELKTNRSIKYTETLTAEQNPQYAGWRVYKVTDKGLTELEAQYTISRMALLD